MSLVEIVDNSRTDKNTCHSYLELYETLLNNKKETCKNVLEIGIDKGGSIKLWYDYFKSADIYGLDIISLDNVSDDLKNNDRIKLHVSRNAYDMIFIKNELINKDVRFDVIVDDGPHSLDSMVVFLSQYSKLLTEDGILILEDIPSIDWIEPLKECVPEDLKCFIDVYDLRNVKGRWDDIVLVINKGKKYNYEEK